MDDVDRTTDRQEALDGLALLNIHAIAQAIPSGHEGECVKCGNESPRLMGVAYFKRKGRHAIVDEIEFAMEGDPNISGVCPPCRDKYHLP